MPAPNRSWQRTIVAKHEVRPAHLTKSYCFVSRTSNRWRFNLTLLLFGGESCYPEGERDSALRLDAIGGFQRQSARVCFPLEACHSPHVTDNMRTKKRGKTVHLGSIYLHYSAWGLWICACVYMEGREEGLQTHTTVMTACRWTWAHWQK